MFKWIVTLMLISCVAFAHEVCHLDRGDGCTVWYFHSTLNERYDHGHDKVPCDRPFVGRDDVECFRITNTAGVSREAMSRVYRVGADGVIGIAKNAGGDWEVAMRIADYQPPTPEPEPPTPEPEPPTPEPEPPTPEPEPPTPEPEPPTPEPEPPTPEPEPPTPEPEPPTPEPDPPTPEPEPPTPEPEPPTPEPEPPTPEPEPPPVRRPPPVEEPPTEEPPVRKPSVTTIYTAPEVPEVPEVETPVVVIEEPVVVVIEKPPLPTYQLRWSMEFDEGPSLRALPFKPDGWNDGNSITFLSTLYRKLEPDVDLVANLRSTVQAWSTYTGDRFNNGISDTSGFYVEMNAARKLELTKTVHSTYTYKTYSLSQGMNLVGVAVDTPILKVVSDFFDVFRSVQSVKLDRAPDADTLYREDTDELVSMLDADTVIEPTQGYLLWCNGAQERSVWGDWWGLVRESQAAPGVERRIATMWGAIKVGK